VEVAQAVEKNENRVNGTPKNTIFRKVKRLENVVFSSLSVVEHSGIEPLTS